MTQSEGKFAGRLWIPLFSALRRYHPAWARALNWDCVADVYQSRLVAGGGSCGRTSMRNPYESLAVPRTATADDIKKSFRHLAKRLHPDANGNDPRAARLFAEVNAAHEILGDAVKRRAFDRGDIDAEGRPRRRTAVTRFRNPGMHIAASVGMVVLTLMFTSTLVIGRLTSSGKFTAIGEAQAERVTLQDDTYAGKATSLKPT